MEEEKKKVEQREIEEEDDDELLDPDDFDDEDEEDEEEEKEGKPNASAEDDDDKSSDEKEKSEEDKQKERNAKAAERRRQREKAQRERAEREAKIRAEATLDAELKLIKVNPYTEEPIEDEEDLKIYKIQKELDEEGKDPINDLPKRLAENARKAAKEAKERQETEQREKQELDNKIKGEVDAFRKAYPNVNLNELANDELYKQCLNGRAGRWTLIEIYQLYLREKSTADKKAEEEAVDKAAKEAAKKVSNPPSATAKGSSPQKSVEDFKSLEEFDKYFNDKYS